MKYFVEEKSVVRKIWGKSDTVLFIFAGAAAEFSVNKAVDWLYFTGKLPADPLGRLFSTVNYARHIVFSEENDALKAIDTITLIHKNVEAKRGETIPAWAYRDVLFMLIHYSIASFEVLERKLTLAEKNEIYTVFKRLGSRMNVENLPENYTKWKVMRSHDMDNDLAKSMYSKDLFKQYKKHLGPIRYWLLIEGQILVVPPRVRSLLGFRRFSFLQLILPFYKLSKLLNLDKLIKSIILPSAYKKEIGQLDVA